MSIIEENKMELETQKKFPKKIAQDVVDLVQKETLTVDREVYLVDRATKKAAQKKDALKRMAVRKDVAKKTAEAFKPKDAPVIDDLPDPAPIKVQSREAKKQEYLKDKAEAKSARIADREKRKAERKVKKPVLDKETQIAEFVKDFEGRKAAGHTTFTEREGEFKFMLFMPADLYKTLKIKTIQEETTISKLFAKQMAKLVKE